MRLFIMDEGSQNWDETVGFFIYGGLVVPENQVRYLSLKLLEYKADAEIPRERPVKWTNNNWNKKGVLDNEVHKNIKERIIDLVAGSGCKIIICLSPHTFYHFSKDKNGELKQVINPETYRRTLEYGFNDALEKFNTHLVEEKEFGMVFADEFDESHKAYMTEHSFSKFRFNHLTRVTQPVIQVKNECSYLHQINDVILGAIYFSLREMEENFLPKIANNFLGIEDQSILLRKSFCVYPELAKYPHVLAAKKRIKAKFIRQLGVYSK